MESPRLVFILATNYSGSHLLAQLLAAHSRCASVGELHNYRKFRARGSRSGNVVSDYAKHPAFADLENLPVTEWHRTILVRLRESRPKLTHLIDNSKRPEWARQFPTAHSNHVHLLRDPRAVAARWLETFESPRAIRSQRWQVLRRRPLAFGSVADPVGIFLQKWLIANRSISRFLADRPRTVVTYRDLTRCTADVLTSLMPELELEYEPKQLRYGEAQASLGTRKRDYLEASERSAIEIDLRWRQRLDPAAVRRIERHGEVLGYLSLLGLRMTDEGLTALPRSAS